MLLLLLLLLLLLGASQKALPPIATDVPVAWSVCMSVCLYVRHIHAACQGR